MCAYGLCLCPCICSCSSVWVWTHMHFDMYVFVFICVSVNTDVLWLVFVSVYVFVFICMSVDTHVLWHVCVCFCICVDVHLCECAHTCTMHVYEGQRTLWGLVLTFHLSCHWPLDMLACELLKISNSPSLISLRRQDMHVCYCIQLLCGFWEPTLRLSGFFGKCSIQWAFLSLYIWHFKRKYLSLIYLIIFIYNRIWFYSTD